MRTSLVVFFLAGCQSQVFSITLDNSTDTVVPAGPVPDQPLDTAELQDLLGFYVDPSQLAAAGVSEADISQIALSALTMSVISPSDADFGFLTHIETWITSPNEGDAKLFEYDGFQPGQTQFTIPIDGIDLTPWVFDDEFEVRSFVDGVMPPVDTTVRSYIKIKVGTTLYGVWDQIH